MSETSLHGFSGTPESPDTDPKYRAMLDSLVDAGWNVVPNHNVIDGLINFHSYMEPDRRKFTYTDAIALLPITDEDALLVPGVYIDIEDNGQASVEYFGPKDDYIVDSLVEAMAKVGNSDPEELTAIRNPLLNSLLVRSINGGSVESIGELSDDERDLLILLLDNPSPITQAEEYTQTIERDPDGSLVVTDVHKIQKFPDTD